MATTTATATTPTTPTTTTIDMYTAPLDVNEKIVPGKVWEDKPQTAKHRPDKETGVCKDVYVEEGMRKIPRDSTGRSEEEEARRRSLELKRKAAAAKDEEAGARLKHTHSFVDLEDSTMFDEDVGYVAQAGVPRALRSRETRRLYTSACEMLKIVPSSRFLRGLSSGRVIAGHQGMGPLGARAVAISLITSLTVTELYIPNNKLGPMGMHCMARLIHGNEVIKVLDISDNELGREGARILSASIKENDSIQQVNAAGNGFDDKTGEYFEEAVRYNTNIRQLDLSRNLFSQQGAIHLAKGLEENNTVTHLDLSYNHIRRYGVKGIARMLAHNSSLLQLDLSWNGIDSDMAKVLGDGLNLNNTLSVLNLTGCRLNVESIMKLLGSMKDNHTLKTLQIADNPLTNADLTLFLRAIDCVPEMALNFIDASSISVSQEILDLEKKIGQVKPGFMVKYRGLLSIKDYSRNMLEIMDLVGGDPLEVIITYARQKNLRLLDLFAQFDSDKSGTMTRQELITGVSTDHAQEKQKDAVVVWVVCDVGQAAGIPLSIKQMDKLVAKLDKDGDGEIDFAELFDGYKKLMRELHRQGKVARNVLKGETEAFPGLAQMHKEAAAAAAEEETSGAPPKSRIRSDTSNLSAGTQESEKPAGRDRTELLVENYVRYAHQQHLSRENGGVTLLNASSNTDYLP